ncbi:hypothetical protein EVA_02787 [gut metagenome]|uniref:Uncharacterized protein n=1 Tax=gut metagenome TaxID=749906 RepID=J9GMB8_9ZZZZ
MNENFRFFFCVFLLFPYTYFVFLMYISYLFGVHSLVLS